MCYCISYIFEYFRQWDSAVLLTVILILFSMILKVQKVNHGSLFIYLDLTFISFNGKGFIKSI